MKIGIVTFFRVANYGAMLQANALRHFLASMGHEVVFISHPRVVATKMSLWRVFASRGMNGVRVKLRNYVRHSITGFAVSFPQTNRCRTLDEVREATLDCDAFIVGSDQVWNPMWCSGIHLPLVMLDFAPEGKPRIAYAASFGTTVWREDQNAKLAGELLRKFAAISVREEGGIKLVHDLSGRKDVVQMLDPTLLYSADFYRKIIKDAGVEIPRHKHSTIFRYLLDEWGDEVASQKAFEFVKEKLGFVDTESDRIPVRGLLAPLCKILGVTAKVTVPVWLAKIVASDFVFTNSFHGTVFAILFHRPFVSILLRGRMSGMNERLCSLLKELGLQSRLIHSDDLAAISRALSFPISWPSVDRVLNGLRHQAFEFLQENVGGR